MAREHDSREVMLGSIYVFACCFLIGPLFGLIALLFGLRAWSLDIPWNEIFLMYPWALILGGFQAYKSGLRITEFLDANGYISFRYVMRCAFRVSVTPSFLVALMGFVRGWAAHDLRGLLFWPVLGFGAAMSVHMAAALAVCVMIIPLMRRSKRRLPTS